MRPGAMRTGAAQICELDLAADLAGDRPGIATDSKRAESIPAQVRGNRTTLDAEEAGITDDGLSKESRRSGWQPSIGWALAAFRDSYKSRNMMGLPSAESGIVVIGSPV